jgi:preprotein translocase subunit SecG
MQHVVIVIHLMLVLALIGVVLLQKSEGGGLGIGGSGGGGFMSSRGTANLLTRATAVLAGLFFATSLILSILAGMNRKPTSILQGGRPAPGPNAPLSPGEILKDLPGAPAAAPAAPAAPSGPQVPQSK